MADRDPWEKDPDHEVSSDPWERPTGAPQGQWGPVSEAANAVLMGAGPTLTGAGAYLRGDDYGQAKAASAAARDAYEAQNPKMALATSIAGGTVPAAALTAAGLPVVAAGALQGAGPGAFAGDPGQAALGGAVGAGGAFASQALGKALMGLGRATGIVAPAAPTAAAVPGSKQVLAAGGQQLQGVRDSGATIDPNDLRGAMSSVVGGMKSGGMVQASPRTMGLVRDTRALAPVPQADPMQAMTGVATPTAPPVPIADVDEMRQAFGNVRPSAQTEMTDATSARRGANAILDLYAQNPQVAALSAEGRGNYGAGLTARGLEEAGKDAADNAQNTGIGMNLGNKMRQAAGSAMHSDEYDHQPDVFAALQKANDGTFFQNQARRIGTALGGGGGPLSTIMAFGAAPSAAAALGFGATGSPWGGLAAAATPVIGHMAKSYDNNAAKAAFDNVIQTALKRSPLYAENVKNFVPPTAGVGSQIGRVLAPSIGAAVSSPGLGALFGN